MQQPMSTPLTILAVDDNETNRKLLRVMLEAEGHRIIEAVDGIEAMAILEREKVDIVFSDILMPRMDGFRLCREVRRSRGFSTIPFVFLTATYTSSADTELALGVGADAFLHKPASSGTLVDTIIRLTSEPRTVLSSSSAKIEDADLMQEYSDRLVEKLEKKNIELLLQATALETAANAVVITDSSGCILWVNPAFTALSGYRSEEAVGKTPRILKSGQHGNGFYNGLWHTILAGRTWHGEFINHRKDGTEYHGEQTITPVRAQGGGVTHFIGIMTDVTKRKRADQIIREQLDELLRWQSVMINREDRVLELKAEINELMTTQGLPPRYPSLISA